VTTVKRPGDAAFLSITAALLPMGITRLLLFVFAAAGVFLLFSIANLGLDLGTPHNPVTLTEAPAAPMTTAAMQAMRPITKVRLCWPLGARAHP
jgi:hypothetical protein